MARIEDYGLIGDLETAALVSRDGTIDWLCFPRFDSGACFAALLGDESNGHWTIQPAGEFRAPRRRYGATRSILETELETRTARVRLIDFMPPRETKPDVVRIVEGVAGVWRCEWSSSCGSTTARSCRGCARLDGPGRRRGPRRGRAAHAGRARGARLAHPRASSRSRGRPGAVRAHLVPVARAAARPRSTRRHALARRPELLGGVGRALHARRAMARRRPPLAAHAQGADVRARRAGSSRRRRRRCRSGSAASATGTTATAGCATRRSRCSRYPRRLRRGGAGVARLAAPGDRRLARGRCRSCTASAGERRLTELELPGSPGTRARSRCGSATARRDQLQLDVYGEVVDALYQARRTGSAHPTDAWRSAGKILEWLESGWREPDEGIWEVRGPRRHFTHSKVMAWVAFDRAVKTIERFGRDGPVDRWRALRGGRSTTRSCCERATTPSAARSSSSTARTGSTRASCSSRSSASCPPTTSAWSERCARSARADARRLRRALSSRRGERRRRRPPPGEGVFLAVLVLARSRPLPAGPSRRGARAVRAAARRCATTSASSPRSTTRSGSGSSATSRRRSRTSALVETAYTLALQERKAQAATA